MLSALVLLIVEAIRIIDILMNISVRLDVEKNSQCSYIVSFIVDYLNVPHQCNWRMHSNYCLRERSFRKMKQNISTLCCVCIFFNAHGFTEKRDKYSKGKV